MLSETLFFASLCPTVAYPVFDVDMLSVLRRVAVQVPCCVRIIGSSVHDENTIDAIFQSVDQPVEELLKSASSKPPKRWLELHFFRAITCWFSNFLLQAEVQVFPVTMITVMGRSIVLCSNCTAG